MFPAALPFSTLTASFYRQKPLNVSYPFFAGLLLMLAADCGLLFLCSERRGFRDRHREDGKERDIKSVGEIRALNEREGRREQSRL